jgi:hypothetical protein
MKKTAILLIALLVLALPVIGFAQDTSVNDNTVTDDTGLGGGENVDIGKSTTKPEIAAIGILGMGISTNPSDPMDFMIVKMGVGAVRVTVDGEAKRAAVGVLRLDGEKYLLRGLSLVDGVAQGDIFDTDGNDMGSFEVTSVEKDDTEIWAGTMDFSGKTYHLYLMGGARRIRASELIEKVADYCRNNQNDTDCSGRVEQFCQNNPEDIRCKELFRKYCLAGNNLDDTRCREYVRGYCGDNSTLSECVTYEIKRSRAYCEENPDSEVCRKIDDKLVNYCMNNTDDEGCVRAKEILTNRTQTLNRIKQYVTKELSQVRSIITERVRPELANSKLTEEG